MNISAIIALFCVLVSYLGSVNGSTFGNGVNLQPSYFCSGKQDLGWTSMQNYPKIGSVRIELDPSASATLDDFRRWVTEAFSHNRSTVIATYHQYSKLGSNNPGDLIDAANWWVQNYAFLSQGNPLVVNLMNEWGNHDLTAADYASAYNQALQIVRKVYQGPVVCDIAGWGQEFHKAAQASTLISDKNIIFSAHIYPGAYDSVTGTPTADSVDFLNATGRPCMIGEFGSKGDGAADWSSIVDRAKALHWPVIGWSWNGDGTEMNMVQPYWGDNCSAAQYQPSNYFYSIYNKL